MRRRRLQRLTACALGTALCGVCAQLALPLGGIPMTLQTFAAAFCGSYLGRRAGSVSVLVYLALGGIGLPIFAAFQGGPFLLVGQNGGFLWGFLCLAWACGMGASKRNGNRASARKKLLWGGIGLLLCHALGILQYRAVTELSVSAAFLTASLPFLGKDLLSVWLAFLVAGRLKQIPSTEAREKKE